MLSSFQTFNESEYQRLVDNNVSLIDNVEKKLRENPNPESADIKVGVDHLRADELSGFKAGHKLNKFLKKYPRIVN